MTSRVPALHVVTDDAVLADARFPMRAQSAIEAGGGMLALHLRGPQTGAATLWALATALLPACRANGARLIINERVDIALASGADGVQLGRRALDARDARRLLGARSLLGVSVHDVGEAQGACAAGADFLLVGAVFPTRSHPGVPAAGLDLVRGIAELHTLLIAIGGMLPERVAPVVAAGAAGVAVLRGVWGATDPVVAVAEYRRQLLAAGAGVNLNRRKTTSL